MTSALHFPALHRTHPRGWINDPNGIMRVDGRWHVYFQYNPHSARHERIHWGHMSSADLAHWRPEPLGPVPRDGEADADGCWSGVGLLDRRMDPAGVPTLVYSGVDGQGDNAFSRVLVARADRALEQLVDPGRVVAEVPPIPGLIGVRDPFVFEFEGRRWAIQGAGVRGESGVTPVILLFSCDDLEQWEYVGELLRGDDPVAAEHAPAELWECPQLVRVGQQWVLMLSLWYRPEVVARSTVQVNYLLGELEADGRGCPRFHARSGGRVDEGPDFYAPQAVVDAERDRVLLWGWSWEALSRTQAQTDAQGWAGCLTFPRVLSVEGDRLVTGFPPELTALRGAPLLIDQAGGGRSRMELSGPYRAEFQVEGPVTVDLLSADGTLTELLAHDGGGASLMIDGGILELLPASGTGRTMRFYPSEGDRVLVRGALIGGWELGSQGASV
ncbi:glycoside hydrolase family 32 protein [Brachybacterium sp. p3-SID1565]|uniref:glycoside hydrolase family 32 protein n=1 Tax=Brachybacterium sp. p3-SID1565 TaxID=2916046 RepID=UPI0021A7594E|nr:glycoside hydrolase family 32 protein [Brachybacterium sp. p3-SID1565]MCT1385388.1 glycoside hydrolase family 32 protein [Brachybacterium sp. p3-SID1565]